MSTSARRIRFNAFVLAIVLSQTAAAIDADVDGVDDLVDNCLASANPDQRDTDGDGIGNLCDQDVNNDCQVNFGDLAQLKEAFISDPGSPNWNEDVDFNGDNLVNFGDLALMKQRFLTAPGPSGAQNLCSCTPPDAVPPTPNAEFNGEQMLLTGGVVQDSLSGANQFADQGGGLYLARAWVQGAGPVDYRVENATSTVDYCSDTPLAPYAPLDLPFFGCGATGTVAIDAPGCYEFVLRADAGVVLPPTVELNVVERLGRWDFDVDPAGTSITAPNGVEMDIPAGAVAAPTTVTLGDVPCEQIDALFAATAVNSHDNRCLGAFAGEPEGFAFDAPVTVRLPIAPLVPANEIPLWLTTARGAQDYTLLETSLTYRGDLALVEATVDSLSPVAAAAGTSRAQAARRGGGLPGCCQEKPTPFNCCCTTFESISNAGDTTSTGCDCELLGFEITTTFPTCPGSPVFMDAELHSSENCPTDLEGAITPSDLTLWTCESANLEARINGTNQNGSDCSLPLPATWDVVPGTIASVQETGPNSATITGEMEGAASVSVTTPVGAEFSVSAPVDVRSLSGTWAVSEDGSQTCITSGGDPVVEDDFGSGDVSITVTDCSMLTIDTGIPGVAVETGELVATGNPQTPFTFEASVENSPDTVACRLFTLTNGQVVDFGEPICQPGNNCQAISCSESITDTGTIGRATLGLGVGDSEWTFNATWQQTVDQMTTTEMIECNGNAETFFIKQ